MVAQNREMYRTDFTVTVDAAERRHHRNQRARSRRDDPHHGQAQIARPEDLVQPGHIFPLRAKEGGVLRARRSHRGGGRSGADWPGCSPIGVLCEILNDDGTMARLPELMEFTKKHQLRICTIQSLIAHRRSQEKLIEREQVVKLPTDYGDFDLHLYRSTVETPIISRS